MNDYLMLLKTSMHYCSFYNKNLRIAHIQTCNNVILFTWVIRSAFGNKN